MTTVCQQVLKNFYFIGKDILSVFKFYFQPISDRIYRLYDILQLFFAWHNDCLILVKLKKQTTLIVEKENL